MIILNTTFFAEESLGDQLHGWIKETYLPAARRTGLFTDVEAVRILDQPEPGAVSFAVRCTANDLDSAREWHDNDGAGARDALHTRWGQRVVWFTTYMETI